MPKFVGKALSPSAEEFSKKRNRYLEDQKNENELELNREGVLIKISDVFPATHNPRNIYTFNDKILCELLNLGDINKSVIRYVYSDSDDNEQSLTYEDWMKRKKDLKFINSINRLGVKLPDYEVIQKNLSRLVLESNLKMGLSKQKVDYEYLANLASSIFVHGLNNSIKVEKVNGQYKVMNGTRRRLATMLIGSTKIKCRIVDQDLFKSELDKYLYKVTDNNHGQEYTLADSLEQIRITSEHYAKKFGKAPSAPKLAALLEMPLTKVKYLDSVSKADPSESEVIVSAILEGRITDYNVLQKKEDLISYIASNPEVDVTRKAVAEHSSNTIPPNSQTRKETVKVKKSAGRKAQSLSLKVNDLKKARDLLSKLLLAMEKNVPSNIDDLEFPELQSILNEALM
jgi:hypothetical protein